MASAGCSRSPCTAVRAHVPRQAPALEAASIAKRKQRARMALPTGWTNLALCNHSMPMCRHSVHAAGLYADGAHSPQPHLLKGVAGRHGQLGGRAVEGQRCNRSGVAGNLRGVGDGRTGEGLEGGGIEVGVGLRGGGGGALKAQARYFPAGEIKLGRNARPVVAVWCHGTGPNTAHRALHGLWPEPQAMQRGKHVPGAGASCSRHPRS